MTQSNDAERFYEEILRKDYCKQLGLVADRLGILLTQVFDVFSNGWLLDDYIDTELIQFGEDHLDF